MFPEGFIKRIQGQKYIDSDALIRALDEPSAVSIRINPSKWNTRPLNAEPVQWCTTGYCLGLRPSYTLDPLFHAGCYYPQEASGMFLELAFQQTTGTVENLRILDLCGAPGGKSTILSDILGKGSLLVANEVIRKRASVLAETLTKWGVSNTLVTQNDPAAFGRLSGYFDAIIIDAPCSGEGMFRTDVARSEWSVENTSHCSERQKRIIMDVWPALKENGILIYSTCTFNPGENEENIKWLTGKQKAESVSLSIVDYKGITEIDYQGIRGYGFYPGKVSGEGFFISAIRKTGEQNSGQFNNRKKHELKLLKKDLAVANEWSKFPDERLLKWGDEVFAVPCHMEDYLHLFQNLKVVQPGTKLFSVKNNDYLPSHELSLSVQLRKDAFPVVEIPYQTAIAYLSRDNFELKVSEKGWNVVTFNGINLGFLKNLGNRINNYFPKELRIRMNIPEPGNENLIRWY